MHAAPRQPGYVVGGGLPSTVAGSADDSPSRLARAAPPRPDPERVRPPPSSADTGARDVVAAAVGAASLQRPQRPHLVDHADQRGVAAGVGADVAGSMVSHAPQLEQGRTVAAAVGQRRRQRAHQLSRRSATPAPPAGPSGVPARAAWPAGDQALDFRTGRGGHAASGTSGERPDVGPTPAKLTAPQRPRCALDCGPDRRRDAMRSGCCGAAGAGRRDRDLRLGL